MADDTTKLVLQVSADIKSLERSLRTAGLAEKKFTDQISSDFKTANDNVKRQMAAIDRSMQNSTRNLTFQLQDVTTSLLSGSSPFQVMAQQSSQAATAINDLAKSGGVLKGLGAAFGSFLNPASLATSAAILGFGYLLQAAQEYFAEAAKGGEASAEDLAKQASEIKKLADAWESDATPALRQYLGELVKLSSEAEKAVRTQETLAKIFEKPKADVSALAVDIADIQSQLQSAGLDQMANDIGNAFAEVKQKTEANQPALKEIERLQLLINSAQKSQIRDVATLATTITTRLFPVLQEAARLAGEVKVSTDFGNPITGPSRGPGGPIDMRGANYSIDAQNKETARKAGEENARAYLAGLEPEFRSRLEAFITAANEQAGKIAITSATRSIERQAQLWKEAVAKYGSEEAARKWVAPPGKSMHNVGGAADLSYETEAVKAWAHENASAYGLVFRLKNEDWHIELARAEATNQTATAQRNQTTATGELASGTLQLTDAQRQQVAEQERQRQASEQLAQQYTGIAKNALGSFISDLRQGVEAGDAFRNMLNRVIDSLINTALEATFADNALGGVIKQFLGLGGGYNIIPGLPFPAAPTLHRGTGGGVTDMRSVAPGVFANAPRLHSGLNPGEFPAILQTGEKVVPRSVVRRGGGAGNTTSISNDISIDISTGMVTANSQDARDLGEQINKAVQAVIVAESRPGGLLKQGR